MVRRLAEVLGLRHHQYVCSQLFRLYIPWNLYAWRTGRGGLISWECICNEVQRVYEEETRSFTFVEKALMEFLFSSLFELDTLLEFPGAFGRLSSASPYCQPLLHIYVSAI